MKKLALAFFTLTFFAFAFQGCGSEAQTEKDENSVNIDYNITDDNGKESSGEVSIDLDNPKAALDEISKALEGVNFGNKNKDGEEVEIVNFRELKKQLPERLDGMKRNSHEGQTTGFGNIKVSTAEARYGDGDRSLDMTITDTGGLGTALMGMAFWSNLEIDKETENGFERTTEINGHKAFVKYDKKTNKSEIAIIYNDRILAVAKGKGIEYNDLQDLLEDMDLEDIK